MLASAELGPAFASLGIALGLGLLVGLQRQRVGSNIAGLRTFALVTLLGAVSALLGQTYGVWPFASGLLAVGVLVVARSVRAPQTPDESTGLATEVATLLMFCVGALTVHGPRELAVALGGCVMVLLHARLRLHDLARKISDRDFAAIVQFALITLVILPVLPDRAFGPYDVLNPHAVWLMVVLVVGVDLGAYVLRKLFGGGAGLLLNGVLGGLVSSTATTASAARQARALAHPSAPAFVVAVASAVVLPRVASVLAVVAPRALEQVAWPLGLLLAALALPAAVAWWRLRRDGVELPEATNPAELRAALVFGLLFAVVLLAVAWAQHHFGQSGLLAVAALSGTTDVDAITLSTARLVQDGRVAAAVGARAMVLAIVANLAFKLGIAASVGGRRFALRVGLLLGPGLVVGALWVAWPWLGR